jgi:hypothetical protein
MLAKGKLIEYEFVGCGELPVVDPVMNPSGNLPF